MVEWLNANIEMNEEQKQRLLSETQETAARLNKLNVFMARKLGEAILVYEFRRVENG